MKWEKESEKENPDSGNHDAIRGGNCQSQNLLSRNHRGNAHLEPVAQRKGGGLPLIAKWWSEK
jgi:hypothetical protein